METICKNCQYFKESCSDYFPLYYCNHLNNYNKKYMDGKNYLDRAKSEAMLDNNKGSCSGYKEKIKETGFIETILNKLWKNI